MSRLKSIRKFCLECMGGSAYEVRYCPSQKCKFYKYRMGKGGGSKGAIIKKYCAECVGSTKQVKSCTMKTCPVYEYRI